jgi:glutathione S-transferase
LSASVHSSPSDLILYKLIADPSGSPNEKLTYVADSFDMAVYLDDKYPSPKCPVVLPDGTRALQKVTSDLLTDRVGYSLVPIVVPLIAKPEFLDDRGREQFCRTREAWFGNLSDLGKSGPGKWEEIHKK